MITNKISALSVILDQVTGTDDEVGPESDQDLVAELLSVSLIVVLG